MSDTQQRILLCDIWPIAKPEEYKMHFGHHNGHVHPLDEWMQDPNIWVKWQESREQGKRKRWTRPHIFSLLHMHHEGVGRYLFGGIFRVLSVHRDHHEVELMNRGRQFIGRLKLSSPYRERKHDVLFEKHYGADSQYPLIVKEILSEPYTGRIFPGYQDIDVSFSELKALIDHGRLDWKTPLENVKGVYLITDIKTNQRYVGSAYGTNGIWSRWSSYIGGGHGGNVELKQLLEHMGQDHCQNFRFALLEHRTVNTEDKTVIEREKWWKIALNTRQELNRN